MAASLVNLQDYIPSGNWFPIQGCCLLSHLLQMLFTVQCRLENQTNYRPRNNVGGRSEMNLLPPSRHGGWATLEFLSGLEKDEDIIV